MSDSLSSLNAGMWEGGFLIRETRSFVDLSREESLWQAEQCFRYSSALLTGGAEKLAATKPKEKRMKMIKGLICFTRVFP